MRSIILFVGLGALFFGWNMPNHYPLWTTFHGELASAVGVCLLFAGVLLPKTFPTLGKGTTGATPGTVGHRLALPLASRIWMLAALVPLIQFATGMLDFRGDAALGFLYAAGVALSVYVGYLWSAQVGSARVTRVLFLTILGAAIAASGLALVQWVRLPTPGWWAMDLINSRPYGNFAQPNLFGLLMVMGIVSATMLFETHVIESRASYGLVLALFGWCLLVCESRANAFGLMAVVACWFVTRRRVPTRLRVVDVLIALAIGYLGYRWLGTIEEALYLSASETRAALDAGPRQWIWLHFWTAIKAHPWAGYGFDQGVAALREVASIVHPSRNTVYAHNVVLDLMTWFGIPLGLIMSLALGAWMLSWLRRTDRVELSVQRHGVFAIWLALAFHSLLEFPFAHTFFLLPAALLAGAVTTLPQVQTGTFKASRPALALALITVLLLGATVSDYFSFESEFRENRFDKANFTGRVARDAPASPIVLDQLAALNESAHFEIRTGMPADEIAKLGILSRRFHLLPTRFSYAKALALNGRMPQALAEMQMIKSIYHPVLFADIDRDWQQWLKENQAAIANVH